jgi:hypothetical protein
MRANDVTCGVDESTLSVIDTTNGTNECTFSTNEQQKVYTIIHHYDISRH